MLTDPAPRKSGLAGFRESDRMTTLDLPESDGLAAIAKSIETAMKTGQTANVRRACADFVRIASQFYEVPDCNVRVLAARPLKVRETMDDGAFRRLRSGDDGDSGVDANGGAERDHVLWHIPEHALP